MNENEKAFNRQYIKYGGIYLDNNSEKGKEMLKQISQICNKVNDYYKGKKSIFITPKGVEEKVLKNLNPNSKNYHPYVNIYCANKNDINAFAGKIDEDYYIGILKGVFLNLKNHIKGFVEAEEFEEIPEIGKCNPKAILDSLVENVLDFFVFHEFFHIMNGHCDLIKQMGINELCEKNSSCSSGGMDLQTMEFDADCCAVASMVNEYFRMHFMAIDSMENMSGRPNINSTIQFLSGLLISTYIVNSWLNTIKMETSEITEERLEKMTHPLPGTRTIYMWATINTALINSNIYSDEEIDQISERSYGALLAFMKEFSDIAYPGFLKIAFENIGLEHLQKLNDNWKKVRELLTVHYDDLAPYEQIDFKSIYKGR